MAPPCKLLAYFILSLALPCSIVAQGGSPLSTCTAHRYIDELFTLQELDEVHFGNADAVIYPPYISELSTYNKDLKLDLYLPNGDTFTKRPAIVLVFGGAFLTGFKEYPQLVDYARYFAKRGYVVACIDYRLGFNSAATNTAIRAVYRAAQDVKAAIRWLKYNSNTYGIDTNYVFAGGHSAGGIASIHAAYVSEIERQSSSFLAATYGGGGLSGPDLGCTECSGNSYGQAPNSISGVPDLVINMWGAIGDLNWIQTANDAPIISFHGTDDLIVLANSGSPFNYPLFPALQGSIPIANRANQVGLMNELHLYQGAGHEPWIDAAVAADMQQQSAEFFYAFMKPPTPTIMGNLTPCGGSSQTYSVPANAGSTYCWSVIGGTIAGSATGNSIVVNWGWATTTGTISMREINDNLFESDIATITINAIPINSPTNVVATPSYNTVQLTWMGNPTLSYEIDYKPINTPSWTTTNSSASSTTISGLMPCTNYEIRIRAICGGITYSSYTPVQTFTTNCVRAKIKVFLEGAYLNATTNMRTNLGTNGLLPITQPYNRLPWNYAGTEVFANIAALPTNATDWVLIEARNATNPQIVLDRSAGILLNNGEIVGTDGNTGVSFRQLTQAGNYFLVVMHRNHLAVMSALSVSLPNASAYDFTSNATQASGNQQQVQLAPGLFGLFAGEYDHNNTITHADYNNYKASPVFPAMQYRDADGNLDGMVNTNDFDQWQRNARRIAIPVLR